MTKVTKSDGAPLQEILAAIKRIEKTQKKILALLEEHQGREEFNMAVLKQKYSLTTKEAVFYTGYSDSSLNRMAHAGSIMTNGHGRWDRPSIDKHLQRKNADPDADMYRDREGVPKLTRK